ncbi:hypothetical protein VVD49_21375 [Uliginosibacterium sp. H3]|uniref:DUF3466 family protein n=1 Tax=Uliginosibacterium silvisoli TaxID=3114758 RepID=A0ABU6K901_9RHOO|nr:hypothetical protein [Uliginosibacterium sp. H3]
MRSEPYVRYTPLISALIAACVLTGCWEIKDLGDLAGGPSFSEAYAINDVGEVVGYGTTSTLNEAFIWDGTTGMRSLGALSLQGSLLSCTAYGINTAGLVVGACLSPTTGGYVATRWIGRGSPATLPVVAVSLSSEARAVNEIGEVAGTIRTRGAIASDAILRWDVRIPGALTGGCSPLPADLGGAGIGSAINAKGFIAGNALVFRGQPGSHQPYICNPVAGIVDPIKDLAIPAGTGLPPDQGEARGINDLNQIVGVYGGKGFLWTAASPTGVTGRAEVIPLEPYDINNKGQIVGIANGRAVLYDSVAKTPPIDLGALPAVQAAGWKSLSIARAINDKGQIVGTGVNAQNEVHGFVLSDI